MAYYNLVCKYMINTKAGESVVNDDWSKVTILYMHSYDENALQYTYLLRLLELVVHCSWSVSSHNLDSFLTVR